MPKCPEFRAFVEYLSMLAALSTDARRPVLEANGRAKLLSLCIRPFARCSTVAERYARESYRKYSPQNESRR
ncbi:Uncharacterised protein [Mycobacteroides abscessus subsp. abscessus]|nr:Uncharacterised protein [Mycobacteroides abscessus subsp. abscessus]